VTEETLGGPSSEDPLSSGERLHRDRDRALYQISDGYHLHWCGRILTLPLCRARLILGSFGGLVDKIMSGLSAGGPSRAHGVIAAPGTAPNNSVLRSRVSVYRRSIARVSDGPPRDQQHECSGQLCRQRRR
jgi:hypothetical protein